MNETAGPVYDIKARLVRNSLISLREIAGPLYYGLLQDSLMDRFKHELPPDSDDLVASSYEVARLTAATYTALNPNLAFIFFRNMGAHTANQYFFHPAFQELASLLADRPQSEQLLVGLQAISRMQILSSAIRATIKQEGRFVYYELQPCPYCALIEDGKVPVCYMVSEFLQVVCRKLLDRTVQVKEETCMKMGAASCRFVLWT